MESTWNLQVEKVREGVFEISGRTRPIRLIEEGNFIKVLINGVLFFEVQIGFDKEKLILSETEFSQKKRLKREAT
ncbi:hypothetical protein C4569_01200 [Candidatus Parcubacteria bacterium]|nr:MAG: hypothetical protein C4569_01200 [Candidatus Parcubacteria bacterium]